MAIPVQQTLPTNRQHILMKSIYSFLGLSGCLLMSACGGGAAPASTAAPAQTASFAAPIPAIGTTFVKPAMSVLDYSQFSRITAPRTAVATTQEQLNTLLTEHGRPNGEAAARRVDFARQMVVGVFLGEQPHGCAAAHILGIQRSAEKVIVTYAERAPLPAASAQAPCTANVTSPGTLIAIDRSNQPVEFVKAPPPESLPLIPVASRTGTAMQLHQEVVVTTQADWEALWKQHSSTTAPPPIDFSKQVVVAVFGGHEATSYSCDDVRIDRVYPAGGTMMIEYRLGNFAGTPTCTKDLTLMAHMVAIPRIGATYSFVRLPAPFPS